MDIGAHDGHLDGDQHGQHAHHKAEAKDVVEVSLAHTGAHLKILLSSHMLSKCPDSTCTAHFAELPHVKGTPQFNMYNKICLALTCKIIAPSTSTANIAIWAAFILNVSGRHLIVSGRHVIDALQGPDQRSGAACDRFPGVGYHATSAFGSHLPDGGHGEVELDKDGAEGQQAGGHEEDGRVGSPVRRGNVARNLVGARRVRLDLLLGGNDAACPTHPQPSCTEGHSEGL